MNIAAHRFSIFADYFQFIVMDENSEDDFSTIWNDEALRRMLAVGSSAICPGTLRNVEVAVEIMLETERPDIGLAEFDHVAEATFVCPSGTLVVMSCTGYLPEAPRIHVEPGTYHALFVTSGVKSIKTEWEAANDLYTVYLWPGPLCEPSLIKHWKPAA